MSNFYDTTFGAGTAGSGSEQIVTFNVGGQTFGISALKVRDVLRQQPLTRVPLAPREIAGTMNLRGHIVTAIDLRARLDLDPREPGSRSMCVVVERGNDQYCLIVDSVGDVLAYDPEDLEASPASLDQSWGSVSKGIMRLDERLLMVLDTDRVLTLPVH